MPDVVVAGVALTNTRPTGPKEATVLVSSERQEDGEEENNRRWTRMRTTRVDNRGSERTRGPRHETGVLLPPGTPMSKGARRQGAVPTPIISQASQQATAWQGYSDNVTPAMTPAPVHGRRAHEEPTGRDADHHSVNAETIDTTPRTTRPSYPWPILDSPSAPFVTGGFWGNAALPRWWRGGRSNARARPAVAA